MPRIPSGILFDPKEIFMYYCPKCNNVRIGLAPLKPGEHTVGLMCNICGMNVKHKPVAIDFVTKKFLTQR